MLNSTGAISVANFIILSQLFCGLQEIAYSVCLSVLLCPAKQNVAFTKIKYINNSRATHQAGANFE